MKKPFNDQRLLIIVSAIYLACLLLGILVFNPSFENYVIYLFISPLIVLTVKLVNVLHTEDDGKYVWILRWAFLALMAVIALFRYIANLIR